MIKKIIFDVDNTLIDWIDEYIFALKNTIDRLNLDYSEEKIKEIDYKLTQYEKSHILYNKKDFCDYLNKSCNINLPYEFVDTLIEEQSMCFRKFTKSEIETLEYLSSKYELLVLSNWFTNAQKKRLENAGILKYFSKISGGDERPLKPSLAAFNIVDKKEECVMIGDSIKHDIEPALKVGMQAILITKKNIKEDLKYKQIKRLEELKEIL